MADPLKIVDPIIAGLNNSFAINSENVREGVLLADQKTRHDKREETKGKMVSIKMDCATRLNRSIYGINLQFIKCVSRFVVDILSLK